jgi:hypothetical protein
LLETLSNKVNYSFPDKKVIKDVLSGKQKCKFYEFLSDLAVDSRIILGIGKVPNKSQLSEIQSKATDHLKENKNDNNQDSKSKADEKVEHTDSNKSTSEEDSSDTDT